MKFVMIVLTIHLVTELVGNKRKQSKTGNAGAMMDRQINRIRHPAENSLR